MKSEFPVSGTRRFEHAADTQNFGEELGRHLEAGDVVILDGPLGAGKTIAKIPNAGFDRPGAGVVEANPNATAIVAHQGVGEISGYIATSGEDHNLFHAAAIAARAAVGHSD